MSMAPEDLVKMADPITCPQAAYIAFKREAQKILEDNPEDGPAIQACLEDAAQVADTIGAIQNGLNRNKFTHEILDSILKEGDA